MAKKKQGGLGLGIDALFRNDPVNEESSVPANSILAEFIGGSILKDFIAWSA